MSLDNDEEDNIISDYYAVQESLDGIATPLEIVQQNKSSQHHKSGGSAFTVSDHTTCSHVELWSVPGSNKGTEEMISLAQPKSWIKRCIHFYKSESLLIEVSAAIIAAKMYPRLGAEFLFPDVTAHWIAVIVIFFLSGFALRTEQLSDAASNGKFHAFVIGFNFLGISSVVNYVAKYFYVNEIVSEDLMKGMIICSCLSMPTNMMVVLALASNGDEAVALLQSTVMNLIGVFVTPLLIFFYLKENAEIDFLNTYKTISLRVLFPVVAGVLIRQEIQGADSFAIERKHLFLKIRERCLVYVVYATFCTTFMTKTDSTGSQICIMAVSQVILLASSMFIAWIALFMLFNRMPKLRVVGFYGCTTKTAALGIPLISAIYEDSPKLGIYTLPLLIWYPSQLVIGTILAPRMSRFVDYKISKYENERRMKEFDHSGSLCSDRVN